MTGNRMFDFYLRRFEFMNKKFSSGMYTLTRSLNLESGTTPKEEVLARDRWKLYRYRPLVENPVKPPVLIIYALVNRYYMIDIQPDRSMVKKFLEMGLDVYVLDWGYPTPMDKYLTMEDYIDDYMDEVVDFVRGDSNSDKINLFGVCQGGTFSSIYTSLNPDKIKNLTLLVSPINFESQNGLLNVWAKAIDVDKMVDTHGNISGDFMNLIFLKLNPMRLMFAKYVDFIEHVDDPDFVSNFIRMEKWIFDSPDQTGATFRKFVKEMYQQNSLINGNFKLGGRKVDLGKIKMPLLNVFALQDHLVPPECSEPLINYVSSKDKTNLSFPTGHIGIFTSSRSQNEYAPRIAQWILDRSGGKKNGQPA